MGIQLVRIHGQKNVAILSADDRLCAVVDKCRDGIPKATEKKLKLTIAEEVTGRKFGPDTFPRALNLKNATENEMKDVLGAWPLSAVTPTGVYRWTKGAG